MIVASWWRRIFVFHSILCLISTNLLKKGLLIFLIFRYLNILLLTRCFSLKLSLKHLQWAQLLHHHLKSYKCPLIWMMLLVQNYCCKIWNMSSILLIIYILMRVMFLIQVLEIIFYLQESLLSFKIPYTFHLYTFLLY